jgi:hypothetical protein
VESTVPKHDELCLTDSYLRAEVHILTHTALQQAYELAQSIHLNHEGLDGVRGKVDLQAKDGSPWLQELHLHINRESTRH